MSQAAPSANASPEAERFDLGPTRKMAKWSPFEYAFWLTPIGVYFLYPNELALLSQIAITALLALSLDLILGYAGILSLGQAAFFGVGAYAAGLLAKTGWGDPILGLVFAAGVAGLVGFLTSFLVLRGSDLTRLMVTLALASMLFVAANKLTSFTGGLDGLQGIEVRPLFGAIPFDLYGKVGYVYSLLVLFALFCLARRLVHSPFGLSLQGIRQNAARMPALGVPVNARLVAIYAIGAAYAGVAGALLTETTQFVSIDELSFARSAELLLMLVLGGAGSLYGAMLGAILFMVGHALLADVNPQYWRFWLGMLLIVVVLFARGGVMGALRLLSDRWRKGRS